MTGMNGRRPSGLVVGSLIAISFGTVFVMTNSGGLPAPWPLVLRVAAAVVAVGLLLELFRTARVAQETPPPGGGYGDRRYLAIVAVEVVALFGGLAVINQVLEWPEVTIAWVALVVGVHFFGLAWVWRMPLYHWLGAAMTVLGLGGFLAYALGASAATIELIAGVGSGVALFATVAVALRVARQSRELTPA
ncbi:hypothetical protein AB0F81_22745 [Actinoplanes sp. NPDC024001]|uniref:hypothetical protein n=1 Tax=Actinoplanes sp. NPDC024001 TaxID=3154598 RepID=UPI0033FB35A9